MSQHSMPTFDVAVNLLRDLDKMDVLTKHAGLGTTTKNYATLETGEDEHEEEEEEYEEEEKEESSECPEEGFVYFEDKEYDEERLEDQKEGERFCGAQQKTSQRKRTREKQERAR